MNGLKEVFKKAFSLTRDSASYEIIDKRIRDGGQIYGTNLCVMMLAVLVASIGLNMNSTAVIIGAMLISPLMGTIMSIGYGLARADFAQARDSSIGFLFQVIVCLFAATVYFKLSPISTAQSELLARTTPTIWDVLIAICGGTAGTIGMTRKESSNVIPGVAIATALMPPLCTAGYGIAQGSLRYFAGAMYLFLINAYFICLSTGVVMLLLKVPVKNQLNEATRRKMVRRIRLCALVLIIPSIFFGYQAVLNSRAAGRQATVALPSQQEIAEISEQLQILYPQVEKYECGTVMTYDSTTGGAKKEATAIVVLKDRMDTVQESTMKAWLQKAAGASQIYVIPAS